jgi:hypothetical protein
MAGVEKVVTDSEAPRRRRSRSRRRARRRLRRALLATLVAGSLVLLSAGWVGMRGWQARSHLLNAAGLARELSSQVVGGDTGRAQRTLSALQQQATSARAATGDPGWWVAKQAPVAGDDMVAVHQIAVTVDELARRAFPVLLRADLTALAPKDGRLDLAALARVSDELGAADRAVQEARTALDDVPARVLVRQIREAVGELRAEIDQLAGMTSAVSRFATLLPPLLGAEGERSYLLVSQNLAELRSTGGMFGAYALLRAEGGRVRIVKQGASAELGNFRGQDLPLSRDMRGLYTDLPRIYPADVNLTPHFPTAAALYREMFARKTGTRVDGVLAADPVVLSYLLAATGPVPVPGGSALASDSVVRTLLSESYQRLGLKEQDEFFAASAMAVFDILLKRNVNPKGLLSAFDRAVAERRILFWSAHPDEQQVFGDSRLAGVLPERETVPTVGVFLNDGSGAKLGYYLRPSAELTVGACRPDGRRELRLRMTLHSTAPKRGLSEAVLGLGLAGDPYTARTLVYVFSPAGGAVGGARIDGSTVAVGSGVERRRQVAIANLEVGPGRTRSLEITVLTDATTTTGEAELWLTPTANPWTTQVSPAPNCDQ